MIRLLGKCHMTMTISLLGKFISHWLALATINACTKYDIQVHALNFTDYINTQQYKKSKGVTWPWTWLRQLRAELPARQLPVSSILFIQRSSFWFLAMQKWHVASLKWYLVWRSRLYVDYSMPYFTFISAGMHIWDLRNCNFCESWDK